MSCDGKYEITLDNKKLRTPSGGNFYVTSEPLALASTYLHRVHFVRFVFLTIYLPRDASSRPRVGLAARDYRQIKDAFGKCFATSS